MDAQFLSDKLISKLFVFCGRYVEDSCEAIALGDFVRGVEAKVANYVKFGGVLNEYYRLGIYSGDDTEIVPVEYCYRGKAFSSCFW